MSSLPGSRSTPARALAKAEGYQVLATGAPAKSRKAATAPAEPSVADVGVQLSASKLAPTRIGTVLEILAPQISATRWKTFRRCCPTVVPVLPPTGVAAVGSLNPSPAPSRLMIVIVAAFDSLAADNVTVNKSSRKRELEVLGRRIERGELTFLDKFPCSHSNQKESWSHFVLTNSQEQPCSKCIGSRGCSGR